MEILKKYQVLFVFAAVFIVLVLNLILCFEMQESINRLRRSSEYYYQQVKNRFEFVINAVDEVSNTVNGINAQIDPDSFDYRCIGRKISKIEDEIQELQQNVEDLSMRIY